MLGKCCSWMRLRAIADTVWSEVAAGVLPAALAPVRASLPVAPTALMLKTPPAKGAIPSRPSSFLLDTSIMAHSLLSYLAVPQGTSLVSAFPGVTTSHSPIMAWSSCTTLWQWMGYLPSQSRKRKKSKTRSLGCNWVTSLRDLSTSEGATRLRERIWGSSRCMWTGCVQSPVALNRIQFSTLFRSTRKRKWLQSMNWPLIDHWPFKRSNLKVRVTLGVALVLGSW